jgi:hypothetical protein
VFRRFAIISALCISCVASPSVAQQPFSLSQFEAYIATLRDNLASVFEQEIRQSIINSTGVSIGLEEVVLDYDDLCDLIPFFEPNTVPPEIRMDGDEFIALSSYISQVTLFYLLGTPEVERPEQVTDYIESVIRPFMTDLYADCSGVSPDGTGLMEVIGLSYFNWSDYSGRPYVQVLSAAASEPSALLTGHYVGGLPVFFIVLHEIGHHVQIMTGKSFEDRVAPEFDADAYAARIIADSDLSPTLALPVMHAFAVGSHATELECRLATLARSDRAVIQRTRELPLQYRQRLELLRQHYVERYQGACS